MSDLSGSKEMNGEKSGRIQAIQRFFHIDNMRLFACDIICAVVFKYINFLYVHVMISLLCTGKDFYRMSFKGKRGYHVKLEKG